MNFEEAKKIFQDKLGIWKIMALATCVDNVPMIRNVSCLFYNDKIYFKTDKNFRKTVQLLANPKVAMCFHGVQVEGTAINTGLVIEEEGRVFEKLYQQYLWGSYNRYSHEDSEILIEVTPEFVEIWEDDEEKNAYQIFIDFKKEEVEVKPYD
ncbi:MAG: pyridoxamine 5'-phosphate oxidase family protein [Longicatena sp.]|nr:pyridoxamine 5'-phosphate oxidase family protein [Longicatena sp.]